MVHRMNQGSIPLSLDQEQALNNVSVILERAGISLSNGQLSTQISTQIWTQIWTQI